MSLLVAVILGALSTSFFIAFVLLNRFSKYAKEELRTGGTKCKCSNPACNDPTHLSPIKTHRYADYYLPIDTPKCDNCHIAPGINKNMVGKLMCNQCK